MNIEYPLNVFPLLLGDKGQQHIEIDLPVFGFHQTHFNVSLNVHQLDNPPPLHVEVNIGDRSFPEVWKLVIQPLVIQIIQPA